MECKMCELSDKVEVTGIMGRKLGAPDSQPKVLFLLDCPDTLDYHKGTVFSGKSCDDFIALANAVGISRDDMYVTCLCKCHVDNPEKELKSQHINTCAQFLKLEISQLIDPDFIVPMGTMAMRFLGIKGTLRQNRGNAQEMEVYGRSRVVMPMVFPREVSARPAALSEIQKDLSTLSELLKNGFNHMKDVDYRYIDTVPEILAELNRMRHEAKILAFDIETTGLDAWAPDAAVITINLTDRIKHGVCIPLRHPETPLSKEEQDTVMSALKKLLEDPNIAKTAHHGQFDCEYLEVVEDIHVESFVFDTMYGHYIGISEEQGTQGLKAQAWEFTDMGGYDNELDAYIQTLPAAIRHNYAHVPLDILKKYGAADADCCLRLFYIYAAVLERNPKFVTLMDRIMMPACRALIDVEINGLKIDQALLAKYQVAYGEELERITRQLDDYPIIKAMEAEAADKWAQREAIKAIPKSQRSPEMQKQFEEYGKYKDFHFNWGSPAQLSDLLFNKLGLKTFSMAQGGKPSTNRVAMEELAEQHEIPSLLLERRNVAQRKSLVVDKMPKIMDANGFVHPRFNLTGTVTGRLSCDNPNIQQMPRAAENPTLFQYHYEPKSLFVSRYGTDGCIMNTDFSALEMRIACAISHDRHMREAFIAGLDIHKSVASRVFGVPVDEVTKDQRTYAKGVGFGTVYGKGAPSFARDLYYDPKGKTPGKTDDWEAALKSATKLVHDFMTKYPDLRDWLESTRKRAHQTGYVETMFGRRRRLPDLNSRLPEKRSGAERQCVNAPIQGTGSDFTMLALIRINNTLKQKHMKSMVIATVHDSLVLDVYIPELPEVAHLVKYSMEHAFESIITVDVPIVADLEIGVNYGAVMGCTLDECDSIHTSDDFAAWVHTASCKKYVKEAGLLKKQGYSLDAIEDWMYDHDRPWDEIADKVEALFTQ